MNPGPWALSDYIMVFVIASEYPGESIKDTGTRGYSADGGFCDQVTRRLYSPTLYTE